MTAQTKALLAPKIKRGRNILWIYAVTVFSVEIIRHIANH